VIKKNRKTKKKNSQKNRTEKKKNQINWLENPRKHSLWFCFQKSETDWTRPNQTGSTNTKKKKQYKYKLFF